MPNGDVYFIYRHNMCYELTIRTMCSSKDLDAVHFLEISFATRNSYLEILEVLYNLMQQNNYKKKEDERLLLDSIVETALSKKFFSFSRNQCFAPATTTKPDGDPTVGVRHSDDHRR